MAELFDLFPDVFEESIAFPSPNQHNGEDRDVIQVHRHGGATANGMGPNFGRLETELVFSNSSDGCSDPGQDLC